MALILPTKQPKQPSLQIGRRFDGHPVELPWPFLPHTLVSGVTGSGKSSWTASIVGEVANHTRTAIGGIDMKGGVELGLSKPRMTTLATTPDAATKLLSANQQLVFERNHLLESTGRRTWNLDDGPAVLLVIDELAELAALDSDIIAQALAEPDKTRKLLSAAKDTAGLRIQILASICRLARSCAITVICATQYPLASVVSSELRSNLTGRIAGRVTGREQIDVALGAGMSNHITPDAIAHDEPGVAHVLGFDGYPKPTRCRAYYPTDNDIKKRAISTSALKIDSGELFTTGRQTST